MASSDDEAPLGDGPVAQDMDVDNMDPERPPPRLMITKMVRNGPEMTENGGHWL